MTVEAPVAALVATLVLAVFVTVAVCVLAAVAVAERRSAGVAYRVQCPFCGAGKGVPCARVDGAVTYRAHPVRVDAALGWLEKGQW